MAYDIYIGNAVSDDDETTELRVRVDGLQRSDAPSFPGDEMTGNGNGRHPGYSQWSEFCKDVGLYDLFFADESGLMSSHPGCFKLTLAHHKQISEALESWRKKVPSKKPGWGHGDEYDGNLARLIWLEWWVRWALENCKTPAIYNH